MIDWESEEEDIYEIELFKATKVPCFLSFETREVDGDKKLYYEMGHGVSLSLALQHMSLSSERVRHMVRSIKQMWENCEEFLLDPLSVIYDPNLIFVDVTSGEFSFLYYPKKEGEEKEIKDFLSVLLQNVDKKQEEGMLCLLRFYNQVTDERFKVDQAECVGISEEGRLEILKEEPQVEEINDEPFVVEKKKKNKRKVNIKLHYVTKKLMIVVAVFDVLMLIGLCMNILTYEKMGYLFIGLAVLIGMSIVYMQIDTEETPEEMMEEYWNQKQYVTKEQEEMPLVINDDGMKNEEVYSGETVLLSSSYEEENIVEEICHGDLCLKPFNDERLKPVCFGHKSIVVGSMEDGCDYTLKEKGISRMHAKLMDKEDGAYLIDLNSTNGTYLNGELVTPGTDYKIEEGDMISFGESEFFVAYEN
ncbi:MAG: FHA domain-containing protein [Lachnospiraceae bacterium]|nr:FHA domain-containing protein [Lachnospiraceae bacterium]